MPNHAQEVLVGGRHRAQAHQGQASAGYPVILHELGQQSFDRHVAPELIRPPPPQ